MRVVETPDGLRHDVPAGITRNHVVGCWTVAYRPRRFGTKSFFGADTAAALAAAIIELEKRHAEDDGPRETSERKSKGASLGRVGVLFEHRRTGADRFRYRSTGKSRPVEITIPVPHGAPEAVILAAWRTCVAAADLNASSKVALAAGSLRRQAVNAGRLLTVPNDLRRQILHAVRTAGRR